MCEFLSIFLEEEMNQYNRLLDPKKDIGRYSGTLAIYLLIMTLVTVLWEVLLGLTIAGSLKIGRAHV